MIYIPAAGTNAQITPGQHSSLPMPTLCLICLCDCGWLSTIDTFQLLEVDVQITPGHYSILPMPTLCVCACLCEGGWLGTNDIHSRSWS
jgi:hypothetical protein